MSSYDYNFLGLQIVWLLLEYLAPILIPLIVIYILGAIALYKMAAKLGYPYAWMSWVPIANTYLMYILPMNRFRVLAVNKEMDRKTAFWVYIGMLVGTVILSLIPVIGLLFAIAGIVFTIFFSYPMYKDLYAMFLEESKAKTFTLVSMLVPGAVSIMLLIASGNELQSMKGSD